MSDLGNKLNTLASYQGPQRFDLATLTDEDGYFILAAKRVDTTKGPALRVEIEHGDSTGICYLPKRFLVSLSEAEINQLNIPKTFKLRSDGKKINNSPNVFIFKA